MSKDKTLKEIDRELEWFIKRTAVEAVNENNKSEFVNVLNKNDIRGLLVFIKTYVPDFKKKLNYFVKKNEYA